MTYQPPPDLTRSLDHGSNSPPSNHSRLSSPPTPNATSFITVHSLQPTVLNFNPPARSRHFRSTFPLRPLQSAPPAMVIVSDPPSPPHVAIFAFPFGSHVSPLLALTRALAAAAPAAIFSFVSTAGSLPAFPQSAENIHFFPVDDGFPDGRSTASLEESVGMFLAAAPGNLRAASERASAAVGVPLSCVVSDWFMWMVSSMAEEIGVPWVALIAGYPTSLLAHLHTDDLRRRFGIEEQAVAAHAEELLDLIPGLDTMRVRDLPEGIVFGGTDSYFAHHLLAMAQSLPRAAAVALSNFAGLDPHVDSVLCSKLNQPLPIAPLNLLPPPLLNPDKDECLRWLNSHAPSSVIYIAFGSFSKLLPSELAELAHGIENSGSPFLWSLKKEARGDLPEGFVERTRERGKLVAWAPQVSVLSHEAVGMFLTHGGWNSVLESIMAGTVIVCRPIFGDQRMVARAAEALWGIGLNLDAGLTRGAVVEAIDAVMKGDKRTMMRKRVGELKEMMNKSVLPGGSSSENLRALVELVCRR